MMSFVSHFRLLGFVLISLGMISLALAGGNLNHLHNPDPMPVASAMSHGEMMQDASGFMDCLDCEHSAEERSLHCGMQMPTLLPELPVFADLQRDDYSPDAPHDLDALIAVPDTPPPRFL